MVSILIAWELYPLCLIIQLCGMLLWIYSLKKIGYPADSVGRTCESCSQGCEFKPHGHTAYLKKKKKSLLSKL